eukprot:scaffold1913_cov257-Pinguiococcus_pyrenoidosus.AAC.36
MRKLFPRVATVWETASAEASGKPPSALLPTTPVLWCGVRASSWRGKEREAQARNPEAPLRHNGESLRSDGDAKQVLPQAGDAPRESGAPRAPHLTLPNSVVAARRRRARE